MVSNIDQTEADVTQESETETLNLEEIPERDLLAIVGEDVAEIQPIIKINSSIAKYWKEWMEKG